jgi:CBS domain containing-hemolysin-like protein
MDFDEILRIVETSPLAEASKAAIKVVVEKARPNGSLSEEEKEQILAIFELEEKEVEFEIDDHRADAESLEKYLRDLDAAVEEAFKELEGAEEPEKGAGGNTPS